MPDIPPEAYEQDCFHPPSIPTEVYCLHCQRTYESYLIEWRESVCRDGTKRGFWCCPTPGCSGAGFGFDIHPVDPGYIDPDGRDMGQWGFDDDDCDDDCTGDEETCCCDCCLMGRGEYEDEFDEECEFAECGCGFDCEGEFEIPLDDLLPQNEAMADFEVTCEMMMEIEEKLGLGQARDVPGGPPSPRPPHPPISEDDVPF